MSPFWDRLVPKKSPDPTIELRLEESRQQLARAERRDPAVRSLSTWLNARQNKNHFGDDLDISFRRRHA